MDGVAGASTTSRAEVEYLAPDRVRVQLPPLHYRTLFRPRRHGEVAMVVVRTPGWVLLQSKQHYPPGIFRLPTGSVHANETPQMALERELHEEANLAPGEVRRLCRVEYVVHGGRQDFYSEIFLVERPRGQLRPNDLAEAIDAWRESPLADLGVAADELRRLEGAWQGWGLFRSVVHDVVARLLASGQPT